MPNILKLSIGTIAAAATATVVFAGGHSSGPPEIKARQSHMQLFSFNLGILGAMAKGEVEYDAEKASAVAKNLATLASLDQSTYWTPGTDSDAVEGTRALPAIWENIPDLIKINTAFAEAATALSETAGDGVEALQAGVGAVGKGCGDCHKPYRKPR
jgi:cytochrome c556